MAIIYGLKVNLSVAIVAMIDHEEVARMAAVAEQGEHHHDHQMMEADNVCVYDNAEATHEKIVVAEEEDLRDSEVSDKGNDG